MPISQRGYVLVIVLLFMQLFALLSLHGLKYIASNLKQQDAAWQRQTSILTLQSVLRLREQTILSRDPSACVIPIMAASGLAKKSNWWWQKHACRDNFNDIQYDYAIEELGKDECAIISSKGGRVKVHDKPILREQIAIAAYYRITVALLPSRLQLQKIILQSTVVKPVPKITACDLHAHPVAIGRQSWREIF